jgi:hypothetical protein
MKKCHCCAAITGEKVFGTEFVCDDCKKNKLLVNKYWWYKQVTGSWFWGRVFFVAYPTYLVLALCYGIMKPYGIFSCVIVLMMAAYSWKRNNFPIKIKEAKEELWLAKLNGGK